MKKAQPLVVKKAYQAPVVRTGTAAGTAPVLLACTGQYDCSGEAGYLCCQPTSADCGSC